MTNDDNDNSILLLFGGDDNTAVVAQDKPVKIKVGIEAFVAAFVFFRVETGYFRRRSDAQRPDPNNSFELVRLEDEYDAESYSFTDFMVHYGWQALYPKLSLDISVGVGIRKINGAWQEVYQDVSGFYYSETPEHNESRFRFDLGLRVGFQL